MKKNEKKETPEELISEIGVQDQWLNVLGIAKHLRINFVIGLIVILLIAVIALWYSLQRSQKETKAVYQELILCNKEISSTIDSLRNDQIRMLNDFRKEYNMVKHDLEKVEKQLKK